jgi:DNA invertase Pin-like site-specific DNA recombinase
MARYGYGRVSTTDQDLTVQTDKLTAAGCDIIRTEKMTGTTTDGRAELKLLLEFIRAGDELVITRIDRLARSTGDLLDIIRQLKAKGASLKVLDQPIDTGDPMYGEFLLTILGAVAQLETQIRKERQMEGIIKAKARGMYKGRKPTIDRAEVQRLARPVAEGGEGLGPTAIAKLLGCARSGVYRVIEEMGVPERS